MKGHSGRGIRDGASVGIHGKQASGGKLNRREFLYLSGAGIAGITLAGLPELSHGQDKKPKYGGRLRIGERFGSAGLDAHKNQLFMDFQHYLLMYNGLTDLGSLPQLNIYPDLAKG